MRFLILLLALSLSGCLRIPVPRLERQRIRACTRKACVEVKDVPVRGFPVEVGIAERRISGELLAAGGDFIWVLERNCLRQLEYQRVRWASVEYFTSLAPLVAGWDGLGALSTLSHGFFVIFSLPLWLGIGVPTAIGAAVSNDLEFKPKQFDRLYQFARFPQGMPEGWPSHWRAATRAKCEPLPKFAVTAVPKPQAELETSPKAEPEAKPETQIPGKTIPPSRPVAKPTIFVDGPDWIFDGDGMSRENGPSILYAVGRGDSLAKARRKATLRIVQMICMPVMEACSTEQIHRKAISVQKSFEDPKSGLFFVMSELVLEQSGLAPSQVKRVEDRWGGK